MNTKGSVKERLRTWFWINQNKKKKILLEKEQSKKQIPKTIVIIKTPIQEEKSIIPKTFVPKEKNNTPKTFTPKEKNDTPKTFTPKEKNITPQTSIVVKTKDGKPNIKKVSKNEKIVKVKKTSPYTSFKTTNEPLKSAITLVEFSNTPIKSVKPSPVVLKKYPKGRKIKPILQKIPPEEKTVETSILEHVRTYVKKTNTTIIKLQEEVSILEESQKDLKTKEQVEKHKQKLEELHAKILSIKNQIELLKEKYDLKGYEELNDNLLYQYIDDFKFKSSADEIDLLTEQCKLELTVLEKITTLEVKVKNTMQKEEEKEEQIALLENNYQRKKEKLDQYRVSTTIQTFLEKEQEYLKQLEIENNDFRMDYKSRQKLTFEKKYLDNLAYLYAGIYVFPTSVVGAFIGAFLIHNSLTPLLRKTFTHKEVRNYYYLANQYGKQIEKNEILLEETASLLYSSIDELKWIKKDFEQTYHDYLEIPFYKSYVEKINQILYIHEQQQKHVKEQVKALEQQKEKQKQKMLQLEKYNRF